MNKKELKKKIEALQAQYDAMPDEPVRLFEVAETDEGYWHVNEALESDYYYYCSNEFDDDLIRIGNHFTDKKEAERMAAFIRKNFLYWRMALKFADGYEFKEGELNDYVYEYLGEFYVGCFQYSKEHSVICMTEQNAQRFAEFCNKHKKELGL